ncbi:MAG: hypothetical protein ACHQWU_00955 [Gemmatimonadales bacterium]|jgi:hypothetical protein
MDFGLLAGLVLLVIWAVGVFGFDGPGWLNLFLTVGVFLVLLRIVVRGDRRRPEPPAP